MSYRFIRTVIIGLCSVFLLGACGPMPLEPRERTSFNAGWLFSFNDDFLAAQPDFADSDWRKLDLPHDWAIEGDFSEDNPSGTGGGALPGGVGWYRKTFVPDMADKGKHFRIEFDGVYMNAEVFVNGVSLGKRPYGYISFGYDLTPYLKWGEENLIAVRVDNAEQPNSRWYSGCGIYRNVWLVKTGDVCVAEWGTYVTTVKADRKHALLKLVTTLKNQKDTDVNVVVRSILKDAEGKEVTRSESPLSISAAGHSDASQELAVDSPQLWEVEHPYMYSLVTEVVEEGQCADRYITPVGIRTFSFDASQGFVLNGKPTQINGVCMHHDLGCLGAAVHTRAIERQLQILKEMGCNGIRCSHNPPAPELLDLCDRMGFIVMDEAFDMWRKKKTAHDYSRYFDEWHERDLRDFILRDRNHPSVFMWSIGNEVLEQWSDAQADTLSLEEANLILNFGHSADMLAKEGEESVNSLLTRKLAGFVKALDSTRPVTAGCNEPNPANHLFRSGALDIIGYNYHNANIPAVPENFPGKPFIITESNSALMTRGYYRMPSDSMFIWPERWDKPFYDSTYACSSYDNCHTPWGSTHEETLKLIKKNDFISGQYVWTGFDYIGEPTPYGWPARSSYFGIVDLAGFPKDVYYLYQSEWTDRQVLHLFPHWNWTPGQEVDMWCYYNLADEVELFVNGKSQGIRRKNDDCLHAAWRVNYEPGSVKVVARKQGKVVAEKEIQTAGAPEKIRLTPDRRTLEADGKDLSFVTVEVLDDKGNLCPDADNLVRFEVEGNLTIAGVDNGSPTSMERFKDNKRKAFHGKCLVVLQNDGTSGTARLKAISEGLEEAVVEIVSE
ncbi:glycoside hydrolase family 2 TIM barrel-domain containing protein [Phocaeicola barnesiae]|uniref:glycoside hydrolase family 2 TIM barrel-domain containing protein n=1 Tax=Phocaeicola barnesiae TaxID=376804 RepID=UPI0025A4095B|nr:glycoside hydrolase family 2 TIM barrel-domain containing protein [Phocaeicola barnesiae]MDM8253609.1 glycoside hydrolase family 2 TIM barrel-domain containing protein [Phocaeicola barnesiae]